MRELDMSKVCVHLYYGEDDVMVPTRVYLVHGTDDPVELEFLLEEWDNDVVISKEDDELASVTFLRSKGYIVSRLSAILTEDGYDAAIAHHLVKEAE